MPMKYVIVGASAAGIAAAHKLRQLDATAEIICISEETDIPYNKCFLADYLSEIKELEGLLIRKETFFKEQTITLQLGCKVVALFQKKNR